MIQCFHFENFSQHGRKYTHNLASSGNATDTSHASMFIKKVHPTAMFTIFELSLKYLFSPRAFMKSNSMISLQRQANHVNTCKMVKIVHLYDSTEKQHQVTKLVYLVLERQLGDLELNSRSSPGIPG
jgi:hypothetical protein